MRIYLDNCSYNRPFDDQLQLKIKLETEAKLYVQEEIINGRFELVWSYILEYENSENPYQERKETIKTWKNIASIDCDANNQIIQLAENIKSLGLKSKDSLHIACAIYTNCEYFITTDAKILNKKIEDIIIISPIDFLNSLEDKYSEN